VLKVEGFPDPGFRGVECEAAAHAGILLLTGIAGKKLGFKV